MSLQDYLRHITMDRAARTCIRTTFKVANSVMAIAGITILLYSVWMVTVCLRDYNRYSFPWFLWASIGTGIIFCFTASVGHAAAKTKNDCLLSFYILVVFLLLLAEILVTGDVYLNDDWDKDFPKDRTRRFDDFVHFVDNNDEIFSFLAFLMLISQGTSFVLAMVLRAVRHNIRQMFNHDHQDDQDFVNIPIHPPYAIGHPHLAPQNNALDEAFLGKDPSNPYFDKGMWPMGGAIGYPNVHP